MKWQMTTLLLCTYGFLKEFRPSEPYLYEYEHVTLNISEHILNSEVYPIWTYSYMVALIPVFLLTDFICKPLIICEALSYISVWVMFVFFRSVLVQQIIEFFYGWATATEVAYFSYIYVMVSKDEFKRVTSYTRAALLAGKFSAYLTSQPIILCGWGTYRTLNWISLISLIISLVFACLLPNIYWKLAYQKKVKIRELSITCVSKEIASEELSAGIRSSFVMTESYSVYMKAYLKNLFDDFKTIYGNIFIVKWSLWWALASCVNFQIGNYTQTLWGTIIGVKNSDGYNGFTEALCPLISIPVVLFLQRLHIDWHRWGELCLTVCSLIDGIILLLLSKTRNLFVMYGGYIAYRVMYQAMITVAQSNLANCLTTDSFGLVFGFNTFVALVLQTLLTLTVTTSVGLALSIRPQFVVYACYHYVVSGIFAVPLIVNFYRVIKKKMTNN